jgi:hypothetical protein
MMQTRNNKKLKFTLLFLKAFAKYWTPSSPILFLLRSSSVSVYVSEWVMMWPKRRKKIDTYVVIFESLCQMLCSFGTDTIVSEVQFSKCLRKKVKIPTREIKRDWNSRCFVGKWKTDFVSPRCRCCCQRCWVRWLSMWDNSDADEKD